jgi:hypothetical protein
MQPRGLNQHQVGKVLHDQKATRRRLAQLLHEKPSQLYVFYLAAECEPAHFKL